MKKIIIGIFFAIFLVFISCYQEENEKSNLEVVPQKTEGQISQERIEEAKRRVPEDVIDFKEAKLNLDHFDENNKEDIYIDDSLKKEMSFNFDFIKEKYGIRYSINKINDQHILFSMRKNDYEKIDNKKMTDIYFFIINLKTKGIVISGETVQDYKTNYINFKDGNLYFIEDTIITKNKSKFNIIFDNNKIRNKTNTEGSTLRKIEILMDSKKARYDHFNKKEIKFDDDVNSYLYSSNLYGNNDDFLDREITTNTYYVNEDKQFKWFKRELFQTHIIYKNNELNINQKRYYMDNYNPRLFSKFNILSDQKDDFSLSSSIYGRTYIIDNKVVLYSKRISNSYPKHIKVGCNIYISVIETEKKKIDLYSINLCKGKK